MELYEQCAWCTRVKSGPYEGFLLLEKHSNESVDPVLVQGYSHSICPVCNALLRLTHHIKRYVTQAPEDAILHVHRKE